MASLPRRGRRRPREGRLLDENLDLPKLLYGSGIYSALARAPPALRAQDARAGVDGADSRAATRCAAMLRTSGVRGLYAGLGPVILGAVPARAAYISVLGLYTARGAARRGRRRPQRRRSGVGSVGRLRVWRRARQPARVRSGGRRHSEAHGDGRPARGGRGRGRWRDDGGAGGARDFERIGPARSLPRLRRVARRPPARRLDLVGVVRRRARASAPPLPALAEQAIAPPSPQSPP